MEERCPKCGEHLVTKTIKKELGLGSIDYPVARVCPKCNWNIDLTGARDIKPPAVPAPPREQPPAGTAGFNKVLTIGLAILVIGGLIWAFFLYPSAPKQLTATQASTSSPTPAPAPAVTAAAATPVVTGTQVPEITPTGNKTYIVLDRYRIYRGASSSIRAGDEVIWSNEGLDLITIASDDIPGFAEKVLDNGRQTSPYMFTKSGTYTYYLKNNKNVNGTIKVT